MTAPLWVVMPVYNEDESILAVLEEWHPVLKETAKAFVFCVLNDGSTDGTAEVLKAAELRYPELRVVEKENSGHGQTCLMGYRLALAEGAAWVLQIDSDGQCDPQFFPSLWSQREDSPVIYGYRRTRDDGKARYAVSRVVSVATWMATGAWVADANVPYRLMHRTSLEKITTRVPPDFHLANILVSAVQKKEHGITWVDIHFRDRFGGTPSVKTVSLAKHGYKLFRQLRAASRAQ